MIAAATSSSDAERSKPEPDILRAALGLLAALDDSAIAELSD